MSDRADVRLLTLTGVAHRCSQETELFFRRQSCEPRYCFELFRRAIVHANHRAWELVYDQYRSLVTGWVARHSAYPTSGEEVQYFVNRAFEKMWVAVPPDKFSKFLDLKSLLRYLQMCVHSVILDQARVAERSGVDIPDELLVAEGATANPTVETQAIDRVHRQEFWRQLGTRLHDEKERKVVYGSFALALKPRELYTQFPDTFRDVNEVYRIKENVLDRLRRDSELKELLGHGT